MSKIWSTEASNMLPHGSRDDVDFQIVTGSHPVMVVQPYNWNCFVSYYTAAEEISQKLDHSTSIAEGKCTP